MLILTKDIGAGCEAQDKGSVYKGVWSLGAHVYKGVWSKGVWSKGVWSLGAHWRSITYGAVCFRDLKSFSDASA